MKATSSVIELLHSNDNYVETATEEIEYLELMKSELDEEVYEGLAVDLPSKDIIEMLKACHMAVLLIIPLLKLMDDYHSNEITEEIFRKRYNDYKQKLDMKLEDAASAEISSEVSNFLKQFDKGE